MAPGRHNHCLYGLLHSIPMLNIIYCLDDTPAPPAKLLNFLLPCWDCQWTSHRLPAMLSACCVMLLPACLLHHCLAVTECSHLPATWLLPAMLPLGCQVAAGLPNCCQPAFTPPACLYAASLPLRCQPVSTLPPACRYTAILSLRG
jgi:hypothetical protein